MANGHIESDVTEEESQLSASAMWLIAVGLSLGPAVSNGFARFAYGLVLPAMRADLDWSYAEAGWLNTANAIGYLIGALLSLALISSFGARRLFIWGMALTALSLVLSGLSRDFWLLSTFRALAGIAGAPVFIAGGTLAAGLFKGDPAKNALAIAIYFGGGGLGQLLSGASTPLILERMGQEIWPETWLLLGIASAIAFVPAYLAANVQRDEGGGVAASATDPLPYRRMTSALGGYFLFGLGYLIYLTFLVAWMRNEGASASLVADGHRDDAVPCHLAARSGLVTGRRGYGGLEPDDRSRRVVRSRHRPAARRDRLGLPRRSFPLHRSNSRHDLRAEKSRPGPVGQILRGVHDGLLDRSDDRTGRRRSARRRNEQHRTRSHLCERHPRVGCYRCCDAAASESRLVV